MTDLSRLLRPASIALVGASPDASKLAGRPLAYLKRFGYQGQVYPVNPKHPQIDGVACCASVQELPRGIDLALILLPAHGVAKALEECALQGVATAISIAGQTTVTARTASHSEAEFLRLAEVDLNPLLVRPHAQGAVALDVLVVPMATNRH